MQQPTRLLSNELRDQQEGKATRWAAFFDFQRAVAPCLNGCLFPTALISSCLNCRSLGGAEICLVSKRMFIPDGTPVLVTEYYILTRRNIETLNMVVCSATNVESCLCLKVLREFPTAAKFIKIAFWHQGGSLPFFRKEENSCQQRHGSRICCLVSNRMFIPDGTPVLVTKHYILTRRNRQALNVVACSATSVESCLCRKAPREFPKTS